MGRMVGRSTGGGAGFVDRHRLFDLAASDFDTFSGYATTIQAAGGLLPPVLSCRDLQRSRHLVEIDALLRGSRIPA